MKNNSFPYANPQVVLVGCTNVGKSTLFNRLLGVRSAITSPTPGVTRDPIEKYWELQDRKITLVDTGGYQTKGDELDSLVTCRSLDRVRRADLILFVLDITCLTSQDEELMHLFRPYSDRVIAVLNKADSYERDRLSGDFYRLGCSDLVCVSAAHNRHIDVLEELILQRLRFSQNGQNNNAYCADVRLAILGRPNAGKSTLVNRLTEQDLALISNLPGTTRDVLEGYFTFHEKCFSVVDTAGIRRKSKVNQDVEYYCVNRALQAIIKSDVVVLLIDAQEGLTDQDKKIAYQVIKEGRGIILGLNKWDSLSPLENQLKAYSDRIRFLFPVLHFAPILPLSAKDGTGIPEMLSCVLRVHRQLHQRITTACLNQMLKIWMENIPTLQIKGVVYKIRYLTQVGTMPVHFVAFGNHGRKTPASLTDYLVNRIRQDLKFKDVPIRLDMKQVTAGRSIS